MSSDEHYEMFDTVTLHIDLPNDGLKRGTVGTIIEVFEKPYLAYEVEFADNNGRTITTIALQPHQIRLLPKGSK
jgi:hypothetical protein